MSLLSRIAADWQKALPALSAIGIAAWIAVFRHDPTSERALFAALLVIYFVHQIEEHLWPGGFRQFTDAHMFHSGNDEAGQYLRCRAGQHRLRLAAGRPRGRISRGATLGRSRLGRLDPDQWHHPRRDHNSAAYLQPGSRHLHRAVSAVHDLCARARSRTWHADRSRSRADCAVRNPAAPAGGGIVRGAVFSAPSLFA